MRDFLLGTAAVCRFELGRLLMRPRVLYLGLLFLFPVALGLLLYSSTELDPTAARIYLYTIYPQVVCVLAVLLLCPTFISAEVEGGTWIYLAVRPAGRSAVLVGKYLAAGLGCAAAAIASMTLTMVLIGAGVAESIALVLPTALSPLAFGAVFTLLGMIFTRRAMAACLIYALIFELALSFVPAVVNRLTISYALRSITIKALDIDMSGGGGIARSSIADPGYLMPLLQLAILIALTLGAACTILNQRQLVTRGEVAL